MNKVIPTIAFAIIVFYLGYFKAKETYETDLEIYTKDNVYQIKGLRVSDEYEIGITDFDNKQGLKEFISEVTANDNK